MIETQEIQVGEHTYKLTTLSASKGLSVLARLTKVFGPTLAELTAAAQGTGDDASALDMDIGPALKTLVAGLNEADIVFLKDSFVTATQVQDLDGHWAPLRTKIEDRYAGNHMEFFAWLVASIRYNFPDFLDAIMNAFKRRSVKPKPETTTISSP